MMKRIKYMDNDNPIIYVVATPIGNLNEVSRRTIEVLNEVEYIYCEDTRVSSKLLNHLQLKNKKLESYHLHNEFDKVNKLIECVIENKKIALISDAGYPIISDPGQTLVKEALLQDINIVVINGPSAFIPALINSGFNAMPFTFIGFIPSKSSEAILELEKYKDYKHTLVFYESCHRINKTLKHILDVFGNAPISISREITKLNEEHIQGNVNDVLLAQLELKGEIVICVDNSHENDITRVDDDFVLTKINDLLEQNVSKKDAIKKVSKQYGLEKNHVYSLVHKK